MSKLTINGEYNAPSNGRFLIPRTILSTADLENGESVSMSVNVRASIIIEFPDKSYISMTAEDIFRAAFDLKESEDKNQ